MARRTQSLTIDAEGRDAGKTFVITEWAADRAERWAIRALLALAKSGVDLPTDPGEGGMAALAAAGIKALAQLPAEDAITLLDELMECVKYKHSEPGVPLQSIMGGENSQIEEVQTRLKLRLAVLELHTGFSLAGKPPTTAKLQP